MLHQPLQPPDASNSSHDKPIINPKPAPFFSPTLTFSINNLKLACATRLQLLEEFEFSRKHWGQGVNYPVGPCWVHGGFWNNSPSFYPVGKGWVFFKSTHQSTHWVTLWKNPVGSLRISFKKCLPCAWATHCGFFQKVPINLATIYPTIYPMGSLRVRGKIEPNWGFSLITLK